MPEKQQDLTLAEEVRQNVRLILTLLNGNGKIGICAKVNILWKSSLYILTIVVGLLATILVIK